MVARSARLIWPRPLPKNSTNFSTTPFLRSIWVTVRTRSVAVTPSRSARSGGSPPPAASACRGAGRAWPLPPRCPPTPQPSTPRPLIIVVCESVPTRVSGKATLPAPPLLRHHALGEVLEVHLVDDPGGGGHDAEVLEGLRAPLQELVALPVALELDLRVAGERVPRAEDVHLDRVVHHEVHGHERVDAARVAAQPPAPPPAWRRGPPPRARP